jgi:Zn-dependent protease with chaperone function
MEIDAARQQKAREYARIHRRLSYVSMGFAALCVLIVLGAGLDRWFRDVLQHTTRNVGWLQWQPLPAWYPWQILLYFLAIFVLYEIITLPLAYYSGYILPHRYGISVMSRGAWLRDLGIGFGLSLILEAVLFSLIYTLLAFQPQLWWLWTAIIILFFSVIMANLAPILLYPLFYTFTPLPDGALKQTLLALAERAHTRVRGVFLMKMSNKTTATNAALMGLGNTRRIVIGDTMTDRYNSDEIEVVLAHELGHHVHHDIWKLIISQSLITLVGLFFGSLVLDWIVIQQHIYRSLTDAATIPFLLLLIGLYSLIIMPLSNGYTRHVEYQADEYALQATGKIAAFKSAMQRLANQNLSEVEPAPLIEFLFYSHPSIKKRLAHADEFANREHDTNHRAPQRASDPAGGSSESALFKAES